MDNTKITPTVSHWGTYMAETRDGKLIGLHPYSKDKDPSDISQGMVDTIDDRLRIRKPHIRKSWLEEKNKKKRGADLFIELPWDEALDIAANELQRIKSHYGNESIFAGSYGWASAGRFHHAQSQLHRFFNCFGGFTKSICTYSYAASETIIPHVIGMGYNEFLNKHTDWENIRDNSTLVVNFGGLPLKNSQVTSGGVGRHTTKEYLEECHKKEIQFININPMRLDSDSITNSDWIKIRPGTDIAMMLGIAYVLETENLCDKHFLDSHCEGYPMFKNYLMGKIDQVPKTTEWAQNITGIDKDTIRKLAVLMTQNRTMINGAWGLQRQQFGEQPHWMIVVLAAMLGQIGLPGGGFGLGYSGENGIGNPVSYHKWPAVPQFTNPINSFIPVARISDMLLKPGEEFTYNGETLNYPNTKLMYWAGGNPFHHQMDLGKLRLAFRQLDTVITNEIWWNSLARHSDIIFPVNTPLERNDIAMGHWEQSVSPMHKAIEPIGESRSDFDIFSGLASRLNLFDIFTENRDEQGWLHLLWEEARESASQKGFSLPTFEVFWNGEPIEVLQPKKQQILLENFRANPENNPLNTPSGKIEIFSKTIDSYNYSDCAGFPKWFTPKEWLGSELANKYPLHLISGQPSNRLHSQLDNSRHSQKLKIKGREIVTMSRVDAQKREIDDEQIVELYNSRGRCLAAARISDEIMEGVVFLPVGAWYDPLDEKEGNFCNHGNPNSLTADIGTSSLGQGPSAHSTLVEIRKWNNSLQPIAVLEPPDLSEI